MIDPRDLDAVARALSALTPAVSPPAARGGEAAVAVCLRPGPASVEALFVKRAEHPLDPWSGDAAFPGGRRQAGDVTLWETAARETLEETGVDLRAGGRLLGRLDDVHPRAVVLPDLSIASFVAAAPPGAVASARSEIVAVRWAPLVDLARPGRRGLRVHETAAGRREFSTILYEDLEIWGLTHRILTQLLAAAGLAP